MNQKLKMGMIGGGPNSFIGAIHRIAARLDGHIEIVAGAFSSEESKSIITGNELGLDNSRIYKNYQELIDKESKLPKDKKIDFISIVTPNHVHFEPAKLAMLKGFDVIIDKPLCLNIEEAKELINIQNQQNVIFCLTHTYTAYPMIKQAKQMIKDNIIGNIKKVYVEYPQAWLTTDLEKSNQKQATWRTDPKQSGKGGCIGDIGTHAFNLAEYVTGKKVISICAHLENIVSGRVLDDDAMILIKMEDNISGMLLATQIAAGEENNIKIRIYGDKGGLEWQQEDCNTLQVKMLDQPKQIYRAGSNYTNKFSSFNSRTPAGHPEGYLEAFANIYKNFALTIKSKNKGVLPTEEMLDFPTINDGLRGMAFIENSIISNNSNQKWTPFII